MDKNLHYTGGSWMRPDLGIVPSIIGHSVVHPSWGYTDRVLDDHLVYYVENGGHWYQSGEEDADPQWVSTGSLLWLAPGQCHSFWLDEARLGLDVYHFRFRAFAGTEPITHGPLVFTREAESLRHLVYGMFHEYRQGGAYMEACFSAWVRLLYAGVMRMSAHAEDKDDAGGAGGAGGRSESGLSPSQERELWARLDAHPYHWWTVKELAEGIGLSQDYFSRAFRRRFGQSPQAWLVQQRIAVSKALLGESQLGITECARHLGYKDVYFFSRQFKQQTGMSPRLWLREQAPRVMA